MGSTGHEANSQIPTRNQSSYTLLGKRKTVNGSIDKTCSALKYYPNFMRSGPPKRILFQENGEWNDFPQGLVDLVKEDFLAKKAVIKVQFNDMTVMLDMLYMVQMDMITCAPKPLAWIDEAGSCYFPEINSLNLQIQNQLDKDTVSCGSELKGANEIKLCIGIDLNNCNVEECVEESYFGTKRVKVERNSVEDVQESSDKITIMPVNGAEKYVSLDSDTVKNLFQMGMKPFLNVAINEINKCSSNLLQMRLELFEKQVEITQKCRGNSNVRYACFPCSKDEVSSINAYGIWNGGSGQRIKYGNGVHLSAVNSAYGSARTYAPDENGLHYMVFCRVILGNVEVLHRGSHQWHASSELFDTGVDDLQNPQCYVIWHMNASTHIFPEYVVSFKMPSSIQGFESGDKKNINISGFMTQKSNCQLQINNPSFSKKEGPGSPGNCSKAPTNPKMRFSQLFEALRDKVSREAMDVVYQHYNVFLMRRISRDVFDAKLRQVVGDQVLMSTIESLNGKVASDNAKPPEAPGDGHGKQD